MIKSTLDFPGARERWHLMNRRNALLTGSLLLGALMISTATPALAQDEGEGGKGKGGKGDNGGKGKGKGKGKGGKGGKGDKAKDVE